MTAGASESTQVLAIYREDLLALLQRHGDAALQIALSLSLRVRRTTDLLADMTFLALLTRIAKRLCEIAGIMHAGSVAATDIQTHQGELAEMAGASREAVNKQLARLREMGLIQTSRGRVRILRPENLRAIALGDVTECMLQVPLRHAARASAHGQQDVWRHRGGSGAGASAGRRKLRPRPE